MADTNVPKGSDDSEVDDSEVDGANVLGSIASAHARGNVLASFGDSAMNAVLTSERQGCRGRAARVVFDPENNSQ